MTTSLRPRTSSPPGSALHRQIGSGRRSVINRALMRAAYAASAASATGCGHGDWQRSEDTTSAIGPFGVLPKASRAAWAIAAVSIRSGLCAPSGRVSEREAHAATTAMQRIALWYAIRLMIPQGLCFTVDREHWANGTRHNALKLTCEPSQRPGIRGCPIQLQHRSPRTACSTGSAFRYAELPALCTTADV
jgi:hypothetical protein